MIILAILAYIIIFIIALIAIILVIPIEYSCDGYKYEKTFVEAKVKWLFGAVKFVFSYESGKGTFNRISFFGISPNQTKKDYVKKEKKRKEKKKSGKIGISLMKEVFKEGLHVFKKIFDKIKPRKFILTARVGFDDPYNTGVMRAILSIFNNSFQRYDVKIDTIFDDEVLEGRFLIKGRIIIAELIPTVVKFMFSRPVKNMFKLRKGKKVYAN